MTFVQTHFYVQTLFIIHSLYWVWGLYVSLNEKKYNKQNNEMSQKWRGLKTMKQLNDWWMNSLGNGYVELS